MSAIDYTGARGSNAGDDFHELWAVQQALGLLNPNSNLSLVTVEGLTPGDELGSTGSQWAGVDCALYFGGRNAKSCSHIVLQQLKYSGSSPDAPWTVSRLVENTAKKTNNSVIRRLADDFAAMVKERNGSTNGIAVNLVSNQPVHAEVQESLNVEGKETSEENLNKRKQLQSASGLNDELFVAFAASLDLSTRTGSRFGIQEDILRIISSWSDDDIRVIRDDLKHFIREKMLPEGKSDSFIDRESILLQFGFSTPQALFPCPPSFEPVVNPIPRSVSSDVVTRMEEGQQYICLHGPPGCGKTTSLQEIRAKLPPGSVMVAFDCYGGGDYLHSNSYRHRAKDAFRQIANELAVQCELPSFLTKSGDADYPRLFTERLTRAVEVTAKQNEDAFVVVAVDAADNSVTAAESVKPEEPSFVRAFVALGKLNKNVRLMITARSSRLDKLSLPAHFVPIPIHGFELPETAVFARQSLPVVSDDWISDFHRYSNGNPRVESYALHYGSGDAVKSMAYLLPQGKVLHDIFEARIREASLKMGTRDRIGDFCAAVIALPRPIPLKHLAPITRASLQDVADMCADLSPAIHVENEAIFLADEDFENFLRERVGDKLSETQARVAERLLLMHETDEYAATYVASALYDVGRGKDILGLLKKESQPSQISDPLIRREVQLQRFTLGMAVATAHNDIADALATMLYGAEALKTEDTIRELATNNPDLAATFMDTAYKLILTDPNEIEHHGPLLFHFLLNDAIQGERVLFWRDYDQLRAWLRRRSDEKLRHDRQQHTPWKIHANDIAAEVEAFVIATSVETALAQLRRWRPRRIAMLVARTLVPRLIVSGQSAKVEECLAKGLVRSPWNLLLLVPLLIAGRSVDLAEIERSLERALRLITLNGLSGYGEDELAYFWLNIVLVACENLSTQPKSRAVAIKILAKISGTDIRQKKTLSTFDTSLLDVLLRVYCLTERLSGRTPKTTDFLLIEQPKTPPEASHRAQIDEHSEAERLINATLPLYDARAQIFVENVESLFAKDLLTKAINGFKGQLYQIDRGPGVIPLMKRMATSLATVISLGSLDSMMVAEQCLNLIAERSDPFGSGELAIFSVLALDDRLRLRAVQVISDCASRVKSMRTRASEKIDAMLGFARFLLPLSKQDARALFKDAHGMTEEMDADSIYQLRAITSLATASSLTTDSTEHRNIAAALVPIVADSAIRLSDVEGFPWEQIMAAITRLDFPFALAAVARWQDLGIASINTCLEAVLETALIEGRTSFKTAAALLTLISHPEGSLYIAILKSIGDDATQRQRFLEILARDELLYFREGNPETPLRIPDEFDCAASPWLSRLRDSLSLSVQPQKKRQPLFEGARPSESREMPLPARRRYITSNDMQEAIKESSVYPDGKPTYASASDVLKHVRAIVAVHDFVGHLNALCELSITILQGSFGSILVDTLTEWGALPAVSDWIKTELPNVLLQRFAELTEGHRHWGSWNFDKLINMLSKDLRVDLIIKGISGHVGSLSSSTIYDLVAQMATYVDSRQVSRMLLPFLDRMKQRIPRLDFDEIERTDVPVNEPDGVAWFLWALLSDMDVRVRWRAAHSVRRFVEFGDLLVFDSLFALYENRSHRAYRAPNAPFYWLAARLWLLITADRVATENPSALVAHKDALFRAISDTALPHVLIREFARSVIRKLVERRLISLIPTEHQQLESVNRTTLQRQKIDRYSSKGARPKTKPAERKFHFDGLDTIPYWYEPALRMFASVDLARFLDVAEKYIVDDWKASSDIWKWDQEPRRSRLSDRQYQLWYHGHGNMPTLERYNNYLEWHGMFCAVGELLLSEPLQQVDEDDYESFEHWLSRKMLARPPWWISDLRTPKPLEARFWSVPSDVVEWVNSAGEADFLAEIGINSSIPQSLVAWAYHRTGSPEHELNVAVHTALVQPETAAALARALQTAIEPVDFGIPAEEDERLIIDDPPYRLLGWINTQEAGSGDVDEKDPFAHGIRGFAFIPRTKERHRLIQTLQANWPVVWHDIDGRREYIYEEWADEESKGDSSYERRLRSSGNRLWVTVERLRALLIELSLDLLVEVEITRKKQSDKYGRHDSQKTVESRYERIYILRRDGSIEAAEGRVGTWHPLGA